MISMNLTKQGQKIKILQIRGGRGVLKKTLELGIVPGSEWEVIANVGNGPIVIHKNGLKVGVGVEMAKKVNVELVE